MTRQNNPKIQTGSGPSCSKMSSFYKPKIPKATECTDTRKTKAFPYDVRYNIYKSLTPVGYAEATPLKPLEMGVRIGPDGMPFKGGKRRKTRKNKSKKTFRKTHSKIQRGGDPDNDIKLLVAVKHRDIKEVEYLLSKERHWFIRANVDARRTTYSDTALMIASSKGHTEIVEVLLDNGADVNAYNNYGDTALINASENGHIKIVEMLLDNGAVVNAKNNDDETARMMARENGHEEVVDMLLENEADVKTLNKLHEDTLFNAQNRTIFLNKKIQNNENLKESKQNDLQECEEKILKKQEDEKEIFLKKQEDEKENFLKKCFEHINRRYKTTPTVDVLKNTDLTGIIKGYLRNTAGGKKGRKTRKNKKKK
jgi:hypothetical protein